jgi:hypothetical protein
MYVNLTIPSLKKRVKKEEENDGERTFRNGKLFETQKGQDDKIYICELS